MHCIINYSFYGYQNAVSVELNITDSVKNTRTNHQ